MPVRKYKATTPGRRSASVDTFEDVTKVAPNKKLLKPRKSQSGRNNSGRITIRHRGGGAKKFIRVIDFRQDKFDIEAVVKSIEYDPNRRARILLLQYADGEKRYSLAPVGVKVGDKLLSTREKEIKVKVGNRLPLKQIPQGTLVHNIELVPGGGSTMVRSAGATAKLMAIDGGRAHLRLPSTEVRMVPEGCLATIGQVSNPDAMHVRLGKAGRTRGKGRRPTVRGKAMNPVDHPHGGGEGKHPIGMKHPKTPWGKPALGVPGRKKGKASDKMIIRRRKKRGKRR
ncbi:50S ribosomal protein L2 [bacterium]|nr:50S ribosomal protein L2 [bacterium]